MKSRVLGVFCAFVTTLCVTPAIAITVDYSNTPGSEISFDNTDNCVSFGDVGCFNFVPIANNINITSGTATGSIGTIAGTFGVGTITPLLGGLETAPVNGTGNLTISDGTGGILAADLAWVDIFTFGVVGGINVGGSVNLSAITYTPGSSSDPDLQALANAGSGIQTTSFQFPISTSLTDLFSGNNGTTTNTSFSGSITAVPIPAAVWLFGSGLLGLVGIARRKKA